MLPTIPAFPTRLANVTVHFHDWHPLTWTPKPLIFSNPYIDVTVDVLKFALSFYAATWIPTVLAYVNDYMQERKIPVIQIKFPDVSTVLQSLKLVSKRLIHLEQTLYRRPSLHPGRLVSLPIQLSSLISRTLRCCLLDMKIKSNM